MPAALMLSQFIQVSRAVSLGYMTGQFDLVVQEERWAAVFKIQMLKREDNHLTLRCISGYVATIPVHNREHPGFPRLTRCAGTGLVAKTRAMLFADLSGK